MHEEVHHHHHFHHHSDEASVERSRRIEEKLGIIVIMLENQMATVEEYAAQAKAAQDETDAKIEAVRVDIQTLMDKIAAIPVAGLTPEQEAALADVVSHARAISDKIGVIDAMNP